MKYIIVFIVGGILRLIGQVLLDRTKLVSGQILLIYICSGVILSAVGIYEPLVKFGLSGATVPLTGFGYALVEGTTKAVDEIGLLGAFTGGLSSTSAGICAAILFGYLAALIGRSKTKM